MHFWHLHVAQRGVNDAGVLAGNLESLFTVASREDKVPFRLQYDPSDVADQPFPSTSRFQYLVTGIPKHRSYKPPFPRIIINNQSNIVSGAPRFIVRESGNLVPQAG
jgi:hypothetical protein